MTKTEKDKMLAGEAFDGWDPDLVTERDRAREVLSQYNNTTPKDIELRNQILEKLVVKSGVAYIEPNFRCDYGYNIILGRNFYANFDCVFLDGNKIEIGDDVQLGPGVHIYTASHPLDPEERANGVEFAFPVKIGSNVWIGGHSTILPGVTIGNNSIIGAGSLVNKDVPANVVVAGNPAKVIKEIPVKNK